MSDVARALERIESLIEGTMAKKKRPTKADLEARRQMVENAERTRRLAEKAQAELDRRREAEARDASG